MLTLGRGPLALAAATMAKAAGSKCAIALYKQEDVKPAVESQQNDSCKKSHSCTEESDEESTDESDEVPREAGRAGLAAEAGRCLVLLSSIAC